MNQIDPYYKKTVSYKLGTHELQFIVSQEIFSSLDIDKGTQRLLRSLLFENINSYSKALDLGCGYGPIGIALKKLSPNSEVHMVDIDSISLDYAVENSKLNGVENVKVYPSVGFDQVIDRDFDLIVSNIPAKIGKKALEHFILDAQQYLAPSGKVIIVVIDALEEDVAELLHQNENATITFQRSWPGHHVFHYQFKNKNQASSAKSAFGRGKFFREEHSFLFKGKKYPFDVSYNLPEFDQLSFRTQLLHEAISKLTDQIKSAICISVNQGFTPFFVAKQFGLSEIMLVDRNLLALQTSQYNLKKNGIRSQTTHSILPAKNKSYDLLIWDIPEKQNVNAYKLYLGSAIKCLGNGNNAILVSTSTTISRMEDHIRNNFEVISRRKAKGQTAIILKKK